ncbi:MAG TPA: tRNA preQ1(34) S-adenosylmethionine ribosyltransferase-isomerase QueA [Candidatus Acidoferrum sp.]|jgi:S-adenosylmethionine:tRNA ribosyltransferase-isomerase
MHLKDLDYLLPPDRIAQRPLERREQSRLLLLDRSSAAWEDRMFANLPELLRGDELLVVNNARVLPARLFGRRKGLHSQPPSRKTAREHLSGSVEVFLTRHSKDDIWEALVRPGRKLPVGERVLFGDGELEAEILTRGELGIRTLLFESHNNHTVAENLETLGHVPLPPYIDRPDEVSDRERYQTVYAQQPGAVAAPTAGLHFTPEILHKIRERGCEICDITLNVGLGTFQPIHTETLEAHKIHTESYEIRPGTAEKIRQAKRDGRPVLAIGTTVVRTLEDAVQHAKLAGSTELLSAGRGEAQIFIVPGYSFRVVDMLLTNFHLPKSTLLALVSAFAGRERVLAAYRHAVESNYRFYSYGDCMLIR